MNPEIGVIRKHGPALQPPPSMLAAASAFVYKLAQRYSPQTIGISPADLALVLDSPSALNYYFASSPTVSPAITVDHRETFTHADRQLPDAPAASANFGLMEASALFERLLSRRTRVESFANAQPSSPPRDTGTAAILRAAGRTEVPEAIDRVLARPTAQSAAPAAVTQPIPPPPHQDPGWGTPLPQFQTPPSITLPAPEIRRVADQVMREIDHRVTAFRERKGRR